MTDEMKTMLFSTVINYCRLSGLTEKQACALFSKKNIVGGYQILNDIARPSKGKEVPDDL